LAHDAPGGHVILDAREIFVSGDTVEFPIPVPPPVARGSVTACLAIGRAGTAAHPSLTRTLVWERGQPIPALKLYAKDLRALWPRGGRAWLVVRYAGQLVATGELRVVVG
jgi:hypothetical protein